jgi:hypothetical protein
MSSREAVRLTGRLQGKGHDVTCTVSAEKVSHSTKPDDYVYRRPRIFSVQEDVPDGQYRLTFDGRAFSFERLNGAWKSPLAL